MGKIINGIIKGLKIFLFFSLMATAGAMYYLGSWAVANDIMLATSIWLILNRLDNLGR